MNKYHNRRVTLDGITFDSQAEAARYSELRLLERAGQISGLRVHPGYRLQEAFVASDGQRVLPITFIADFEYQEQGKTIVEDVKGCVLPTFLIKRKLFLKRYPALTFRLVRA